MRSKVRKLWSRIRSRIDYWQRIRMMRRKIKRQESVYIADYVHTKSSCITTNTTHQCSMMAKTVTVSIRSSVNLPPNNSYSTKSPLDILTISC